MSLNNLRANDVTAGYTGIASEDFGESVTYKTDDDSRSITVVVHETDDDTNFEGGYGEQRQYIKVNCIRSASTGIDDPKRGDTILRAVADDPYEEEYAWTGRKSEQTTDDWVLEFSRVRYLEHGAGN